MSTTELAVSNASGELSAIISAAAQSSQIDVAKLQALLDMRERVLKHDAEVAFNQAMRAAQAEMVPIWRDAENSHTRSRYARLESIDAAIRPVYTKHGFSMSFNSAEPKNPGAARIICQVRHDAGHTQTYELEGDLDTAGAKGTSNKTSIQGLGSTVSYLRRYLTVLIFNIALTNEDNDGQRTSVEFVTPQQADSIRDLLAECGMSPDNEGFLAFAGADRVEHIQPIAYQRVIKELERRRAAR